VFCNPHTGRPMEPKRDAGTFKDALKRAKITDYVRPFHDGRHTSITNSAAAGMEPMKMMKRAGHADLATTMIYVNLAGETFPEAAELLEERLFGQKLGQK
jgi:integrase